MTIGRSLLGKRARTPDGTKLHEVTEKHVGWEEASFPEDLQVGGRLPWLQVLGCAGLDVNKLLQFLSALRESPPEAMDMGMQGLEDCSPAFRSAFFDGLCDLVIHAPALTQLTVHGCVLGQGERDGLVKAAVDRGTPLWLDLQVAGSPSGTWRGWAQATARVTWRIHGWYIDRARPEARHERGTSVKLSRSLLPCSSCWRQDSPGPSSPIKNCARARRPHHRARRLVDAPAA